MCYVVKLTDFEQHFSITIFHRIQHSFVHVCVFSFALSVENCYCFGDEDEVEEEERETN